MKTTSLFEQLAEAASPKNYYYSQLSNVNAEDASIKVKNYYSETNTLPLNNESASILVKWLKENFEVKE